ncbi:hypothetical protein ACQQCD_05980 [Pseudarthrobacter sp. J1763]|uniref:hypothetical protein n=1 Tax=Pseudarthrobacter sp. J1763 TaxID=3420445 RepID=UPI003D2DA82D
MSTENNRNGEDQTTQNPQINQVPPTRAVPQPAYDPASGGFAPTQPTQQPQVQEPQYSADQFQNAQQQYPQATEQTGQYAQQQHSGAPYQNHQYAEPAAWGAPAQGAKPASQWTVKKTVIAAGAAVVIAGGAAAAVAVAGNNSAANNGTGANGIAGGQGLDGQAQDGQMGPGAQDGQIGGGMGGMDGGMAGPGNIAALNSVHGEYVVLRNQKYVTVGEQTGTVTEVSSTSVTVKSADGFTRSYSIGTGVTVSSGGFGRRQTSTQTTTPTIADVVKGATVRISALKNGDSYAAESIQLTTATTNTN